ncbi:MAG: hypothetical protein F6K09_13120 [Merismopedia sp. SIO2A8]|nr:hypothetical protein [Merismopedia sp. SIO2A8]
MLHPVPMPSTVAHSVHSSDRSSLSLLNGLPKRGPTSWPTLSVWKISIALVCQGVGLGASEVMASVTKAIAQPSSTNRSVVSAQLTQPEAVSSKIAPSKMASSEMADDGSVHFALGGATHSHSSISTSPLQSSSSLSSVPPLVALSPPPTTATAVASPLGLNFTPPPTAPTSHVSSTAPISPTGPSLLSSSTSSLSSLFTGDSSSLVAIAIGCAEGTRTPDGGKTWAFKGHTDPGNGVWNLGTFSWQHGATSPEEADRKQLARLQRQAKQLNQQAIALGVPWGLVEQLNALDLANQSPSAALNPGGYLERLHQAHKDGLRGYDAILWARTWSYRHPDGNRWNAPGLGNTHHGIRTDQKRRMDAIQDAIAHFPANTMSANPIHDSPQTSKNHQEQTVTELPQEVRSHQSIIQRHRDEESWIDQLFSTDLVES